MSIPETFDFDNRGEVVKKHWFKPYFVSIIIVLVALLSFGVGRLTGTDTRGVEITLDQSILNSPDEVQREGVGGVSASVNGTRYYYSHCKSNISEKNKIYFASALLAEEAGYTLALNCKVK